MSEALKMFNEEHENVHAGEGVVYLAFGQQYQDEAKRSLRSLRKVSNVSTAVVTDRAWAEEPCPDHFVVRRSLPSFRSKPLYIYEGSPFERTLFLDTDTVLGQDIVPVFGLLGHYDIGVQFGGPQLNEGEGLTFHTQCNSGVILFRKCDEVRGVFSKWLELYDDAAARLSADDARGLGDQRYLALAIALSRARPVHLESYLNFHLINTVSTCSPPVVYHGRLPWMEVLADTINRSWDPETDWWSRTWLPNIAGFLPRGVRRSDPLLATALVLRRLYNELRWRAKMNRCQKKVIKRPS